MVEFVTDFPFRKLVFDKYLTLEMMMYVKHSKVCKFMFEVNKPARAFLQYNFTAIQNGFTNDNLIVFQFNNSFNDYIKLEKLYLQVLKRRIGHRTITIHVEFPGLKNQPQCNVLNHVLKWIKL